MTIPTLIKTAFVVVFGFGCALLGYWRGRRGGEEHNRSQEALLRAYRAEFAARKSRGSH